METAARMRSRRGRPSREHQVAERRRALLEAAGVVFRRDGYLAATVDSIAEAAELTKGAVYSHFESKADLFLHLLEQRIADRAANHESGTQSDPDESASALLEQAIATSLADPAWNLALIEFRLVAARDPDLNDRYRRAHDVAVAGLAQALGVLYEATGVTPPSPLETLASTALAIEAGSTLEALVADEPGSNTTAIKLVQRLLGLPSIETDETENE